MSTEQLIREGRIPKRWEIYYYFLVGYINYWIVKLARNLKGRNSNINPNTKSKNQNSDLEINLIEDISGGDISNNHELALHLSESSLNKDIINAAKKGCPLIKLGDGSAPRVMITTGVHGNEIPPQVAALRIIEELKEITINGTVYLVPFTAPQASADNSKLADGKNLNLVANQPDSATNKVFHMAQKLGVNSLADYHSTSTHPADDSVIYFPSVKSSKIGFYVNRESKSRLLAHIEHTGTLITLCNTHNIPSILCEVESPDGIASDESIEVSYNQMKAYLEYHQII
jgi:uncharacterized protein